jgi:predicted nucleic acid-binding protein
MAGRRRVALHSCVLAAAEGMEGTDRQARAVGMLRELADDDVMVPAQALGELYVRLRQRADRAATAVGIVRQWHAAYAIVSTRPAGVVEAMELSVQRGISLWDALALEAAAQSGCRVLFSDTIPHGVSWRGTIVRNPFRGRSASGSVGSGPAG